LDMTTSVVDQRARAGTPAVHTVTRPSLLERLVVAAAGRSQDHRASRLLSGDEHDAKARFVAHHPPVGLLGLREREGFDHRPYALERADRERVLVVDRVTREGADDRALPEDERNGVDAHRLIANARNDHLASR